MHLDPNQIMDLNIYLEQSMIIRIIGQRYDFYVFEASISLREDKNIYIQYEWSINERNYILQSLQDILDTLDEEGSIKIIYIKNEYGEEQIFYEDVRPHMQVPRIAIDLDDNFNEDY